MSFNEPVKYPIKRVPIGIGHSSTFMGNATNINQVSSVDPFAAQFDSAEFPECNGWGDAVFSESGTMFPLFPDSDTKAFGALVYILAVDFGEEISVLRRVVDDAVPEGVKAPPNVKIWKEVNRTRR